MCAGIRRRRVLPSPVCAYNWPMSCCFDVFTAIFCLQGRCAARDQRGAHREGAPPTRPRPAPQPTHTGLPRRDRSPPLGQTEGRTGGLVTLTAYSTRRSGRGWLLPGPQHLHLRTTPESLTRAGLCMSTLPEQIPGVKWTYFINVLNQPGGWFYNPDLIKIDCTFPHCPVFGAYLGPSPAIVCTPHSLHLGPPPATARMYSACWIVLCEACSDRFSFFFPPRPACWFKSPPLQISGVDGLGRDTDNPGCLSKAEVIRRKYAAGHEIVRQLGRYFREFLAPTRRA